MIESIFKFNDTKSKDIMTSRKDTFSINIDDDIEENIDKLLNSNYSRIPVYKDNIDNIIGIVHVRDILIQAKDRGFENINLEEIMHKPYFLFQQVKKLMNYLKFYRTTRYTWLYLLMNMVDFVV